MIAVNTHAVSNGRGDLVHVDHRNDCKTSLLSEFGSRGAG